MFWDKEKENKMSRKEEIIREISGDSAEEKKEFLNKAKEDAYDLWKEEIDLTDKFQDELMTISHRHGSKGIGIGSGSLIIEKNELTDKGKKTLGELEKARKRSRQAKEVKKMAKKECREYIGPFWNLWG